MADPVSTLLPDGQKSTADLRALMKRMSVTMTLAEAQAADLDGYTIITISDLSHAQYQYDNSSTDADDDGVTTIVDANNRRFVRVTFRHVSVTQAEYDALTPNAQTIYYVTE